MSIIPLLFFLSRPSTSKRTPPPPATTAAEVAWGSQGAIIAPCLLSFAYLRDAAAPKKTVRRVKFTALLPENLPTNARKSFARIFSILRPISIAYD